MLRALASAHRHLAELKGRAAAIPNQGILIDTLSLQEAKASSEIENIVTTQDELFQAGLFPEGPGSPAAKGNGRVGRIINVLFLVKAGLLDTPILYLSRFITSNKAIYYRLLQGVRDDGAWEEWLLYMLEAVAVTARQTLELIEGMRILMVDYKRRMRDHATVRYSQDLLNNLFRHPSPG